MVTTVGSSSYKFRIGDNATAGQGTYEVYLNPLDVTKNITPISQQNTEVITDGDMSSIGNAGGIDVNVIAQNIEIPYVAATRENFEKAIIYWQKQNTLLYVTHKIDATDWLTFPDYATQAMAAFRGKLKPITGYKVTTEAIKIAQIQIRRYTI